MWRSADRTGHADAPQDDLLAPSADGVLIARDPKALEAGELATRAEPLEPAPQMSLWTDQFNNLIDVLKTRPWDELKGLLHLE